MSNGKRVQDTTETQMLELRSIIRRLRGDDGCPWDRQQTPQSIKKYLLEETYELIEAIDEDDPVSVSEELGDLFFMLLFVAHLYEEKGRLSLDKALCNIKDKMIRRHPHIFGDVKVSTTEEVAAHWQVIKEKESKEKGERHSVLGKLPKVLPSLQRAYRVGERASRVGFDWERPEDVLEKVEEEKKELLEAIKSSHVESIKHEIGDMLFSVANLSRLLDINPEEAAKDAVDRFIKRFHAMEEHFKTQGKELSQCTMEEMDEVWEKVKGGERL